MQSIAAQLLEEAEVLLSGERLEHPMRRRTIVNRIYLAAYHRAVDLHQRLTPEKTGRSLHERTGVHQALINELMDVRDKEVQRVASTLSRLKAARTLADYRFDRQPHTLADVKVLYAEAADLIEFDCPAIEARITPR